MNNLKLILASVFILILFIAISLAAGNFNNRPNFLNVVDLEKEFPVGTDVKILQKKILASGYKNVACSNLKKFKTNEKSACFLKRYCYPSDGVNTSIIGVAYSNSGKVLQIEGGFVMSFHERCK